MGVVMAIDYRRIRDAWPLLYLAIIPLLAGVVVLGRNHNGAQAWFQVGPFQFQPSEIAKVVAGRRDRGLLPSTSRRSRRVAGRGRGRARGRS